jgi:hypothetical protein
MDLVRSRHGVPIRLTDERWAHLAEEHTERTGLRDRVFETVAGPEKVLAGNQGERLALRQIEDGKYLVVVSLSGKVIGERQINDLRDDESMT